MKVKRSKHSKCYERVATYGIGKLGKLFASGQDVWEHPQYGIIRLKSKRLQVFAQNGFKCVTCGKQAKFFAVERHYDTNSRYHINVYGIDSTGQELLMTRDHIVARANGGLDTLQNQQTMCITCNQRKGHK